MSRSRVALFSLRSAVTSGLSPSGTAYTIRMGAEGSSVGSTVLHGRRRATVDETCGGAVRVAIR